MKTKSSFIRISVHTCSAITFAILAAILLYIFIKGAPNITPSLFSPSYNSENVSLFPALVNTLILTVLALLAAVPLGVFSAIYLVEYAKRGNKLVSFVRLTAETLSGIPSIVYGLFGYLMFATAFGWGYSVLGGALTMAIMILPLIMRTTEEALKSVPDSYREGSLGLGAGKLRTVIKIVLPPAMPGILSGVILAVGRIVGETAALIYTAGSVPQVAKGLFSSGRTLAIHMYALWSEGFNSEQSYATAVILLIIVALLNFFSSRIAGKIMKGNQNG